MDGARGGPHPGGRAALVAGASDAKRVLRRVPPRAAMARVKPLVAREAWSRGKPLVAKLSTPRSPSLARQPTLHHNHPVQPAAQPAVTERAQPAVTERARARHRSQPVPRSVRREPPAGSTGTLAQRCRRGSEGTQRRRSSLHLAVGSAMLPTPPRDSLHTSSPHRRTRGPVLPASSRTAHRSAHGSMSSIPGHAEPIRRQSPPPNPPSSP
jgi:hypothetical protein